MFPKYSVGIFLELLIANFFQVGGIMHKAFVVHC